MHFYFEGAKFEKQCETSFAQKASYKIVQDYNDSEMFFQNSSEHGAAA